MDVNYFTWVVYFGLVEHCLLFNFHPSTLHLSSLSPCTVYSWTCTFIVGTQLDHVVTCNDPKEAKHPLHHWDSTQRERVMDTMKVQHLEWGEYKLDEVLASKIMDFLEEVEGTSNANGMQGGSYIN
jgi:hypothetical protein